VFGVTALLLAVAGIYGVMNYAVVRRTREIGIRMSVGARSIDVVRDIAAQGMAQAGLGAILGFGGAVFLAGLMSEMLYGVRPGDPVTFVGASLLLLLASLFAICIPAYRAVRIDPVKALRNE
jgi:ABC-type antimicrobial peptide transport system permease subunit